MTNHISEEYFIGASDERPWGAWKVTDIGEGFVVKTITVDPGMRLSLQYHLHRTEFWTVIQGQGVAEIGGETFALSAGNSVIIQKRAYHRLSCSGDIPLVIVEIQTGEILEESDIVRLEDDFDRI